MSKLIVANLKMHFTPYENESYLKALISKVEASQNQICICCPFTNLQVAKQNLMTTKISLGAQNVHEEDFGAFTGEISAEMLKSLNVAFCIVGHSERRKYFFETDELVNKKIKALLKNSIKPIVCVGESLKEKQDNKTSIVLKKQVEKALNGIYENELKSIVIAYEPLWAIGTGNNATLKDIELAIKTIRKVIEQTYSLNASNEVIVLYGGSVKADNFKAYLESKHVDGFLVGGASLNVDSFEKIIN